MVSLLGSACGSEDAGRSLRGDDAGSGEDTSSGGDAGAGGDSAPDSGEPTPDGVETPDVDAGEDAAPDVQEEPPVPTTVNTTVTASSVAAGTVVGVVCDVQDQFGQPMAFETPPFLRFLLTPEASAVEQTASSFRPIRVGSVEVACTLGDPYLVDLTPETVEVTPGPLALTVATSSVDQAIAGEPFEVACEGFDQFGNRVAEAPWTLLSNPFGSDVTLEGQQATITRTGFYQVSCDAPGASDRRPDLVEVIPNIPAAISVVVIPTRDLYAVGEVVTLVTVVTDRYGNVIPDAAVVYTSDPLVPAFGTGRYRFDGEGTFDLIATVNPPTESGEPLVASARVVVNGDGPVLSCVSPFDGEMLTLTPGTPITFVAGASDTFDVTNVLINGERAAVRADGDYEVTIPTRRGINFIDVSAQDGFGEENSTLCAFLVNDRYVSPTQFLGGAVSLRLTQNAIDDGNRAGAINSFNDILHRILNFRNASGRLGIEELVATAIAPGTQLVDECFARVCVPFTSICTCTLTAQVRYNSLTFGTPNVTALTLVEGGLRLSLQLNRIRLNLTARSNFLSLGNIVDTTGNIDLDNLRLITTLNLGIGADGRPAISVRPGSTTFTVGGIAARNWSGIDGQIVQFAVNVVGAILVPVVNGVLQGFVEGALNDALNGIFSSLDSDALGTAIDVPRLDGTGVISLGFGLNFSAINATPARALFGLGTRISATPVRPAGPGAFRNQDPTLLDSGIRDVSAGVHLGLLNQILHGLWSAGLFDGNIGGAAGLGGDGTSVQLQLDLPPVALGRADGGILIHLGAARLVVDLPGTGGVPIQVRLGAVAQANVTIVDDPTTPDPVIEFGDVSLVELYLATVDASVTATTRATLERFLRNLVESVLEEVLNSALPALPVPRFDLPADLARFGLPAGASLGLVAPVLNLTLTHFVLQGNFGIE
jgi:hypothetical protein